MGIMDKLKDKLATATGSKGPGVPEVDSRIKEIAGQQRAQAAEFKANLPEYKEQQFNTASDQMKRGLAGQLADVNKASNQRGLLYSGLRQAGAGQAHANLAGGLSEARANINQGAEDQARNMEMSAIQTGMGQQQANMNREQLLYQQALSNYQRNQGMMGGLLGGAGKMLGSIFGG